MESYTVGRNAERRLAPAVVICPPVPWRRCPITAPDEGRSSTAKKFLNRSGDTSPSLNFNLGSRLRQF